MAPQEQPSKERGEGITPITTRKVEPYSGDIVIAGISGRYPDSDNVGEFEYNLLNGINMISVDDRRWEPGLYGTPLVMGKLKNVTDFDAEFFGVHSKSANTMDPMLRLLLEVVYEAIVDSGESLASMKGTRTGVYIGVSNAEFEVAIMKKWTEDDSYMVQGTPHSMFPNWINFFFDLRGPSCAYDTACSTSLVCLDAAERHMRMGLIDCAIVGGCNIMYRADTSKVFMSMNFLGQTGCKAFDASGDGFVRAEVVSAILLKKPDAAKRVYCSLVATMSNNDGFQPNGILYPNTVAQEELMKDIYSNTKVDPNDIKYFECHGTGTQAGDPQETKAVCNAICTKRKDPLLIGSVKTNMGHGETASGIAGISKVMVIMHSRTIPPNLHFNTPNPNIPGLFDGRLKVVTEPTPFDGGFVAINSFGMGGTNCHAIFKSFDKKLDKPHPASDKPRLFVYSARTEDGLRNIFEDVREHASNVEFHALCQESANTWLKSMPYRGATILNAQDEYTEINKCPSKPREVWFIYSGMGSQWLGMGRDLMELDVFRDSIQQTSDILKPFGIDLMDVIVNGDENCLKTIMNPFICISAVQLGLTDLLKSMGITPDGMVGHSLGEVACGYADGCLTRREAILSSYWRGRVVIEGNVPPGRMAAVELTWEEAKRRCPPDVVAACHNSEDSVTISGGEAAMAKFVKELNEEGIVVKDVNSNNISYHSHYMKQLSVKLREALEKEIVSKPRSQKWVSTSIPEERWGEAVAQDAGAAYHGNNLLSPVLFYEGLQKVPSNAIVIEIAPSGLLQSVIKKTLGTEFTGVSLQKRKHTNNLEFFFASLGKCYAHGVSMNPLGLYPPVQFPVSIETPMVGSLVSQAWDHSTPWRVPTLEDYNYESNSSDTTFDIDISEDSPDFYLADHEVDGRMLFPATGTLVLAWKTLAALKGMDFEKMAVQLTNVQIHQALFLNPSAKSTVSVSVMPITGEFQVRGNDTLLSSGVITTSEENLLETDQHLKRESVLDDKADTEIVSGDEVYRELLIRGYEYGPYFQGIRRASIDGRDTDIKWDGHWISYLDTVLQMGLLAHPGDHQTLPVLLESVIMDPRAQPPAPAPGVEAECLPGYYDDMLDICAAGGIEIRGTHTIRASRRLTHAPPVIEDFSFAPYMDPKPDQRTHPAVSPALRAYSDACFEYARQGMKRWLAEDKDNVLPHKPQIAEALALANKIASTPDTASNYAAAKSTMEALINSKNGHGLPNYGVFEMLSMSFDEPLCGDFWENLRKKLHEVRSLLWDDPLVAAMETGDIVKFVVETVADNVCSQVFDILEVGAARGAYYRQAIPKVGDYLSVKDYRYTIADKFFVEDAVDFPVKILQFDPLEPQSFPESMDNSCDVLILKWVMHMQVDLDEAITAFSKMVKPGGFLLVEENVERLPTLFPIKAIVSQLLEGKGGPEGDRIMNAFYTDAQWTAFFARHGFETIMHRHDGISASLFLLRKPQQLATPPVIVYLDDLKCSWLEEVQAKLLELEDSPKDARLWLVSRSEINGMLGFYRSLTWEFSSEKIRCISISDPPGSKLPKITADSAEFKELARKDMTYNIYKNGTWGTYRGFVVSEDERNTERTSQCVFADSLNAGDLSSLRWFDSPLLAGHHNGVSAKDLQPGDVDTCAVYYAGLNQRDVQLANGAVKRDILPEETHNKEGVLGIEFSGRNSAGKRVMGLCSPPAMASAVQCPVSTLWTVPDHWTLEEAATVPVAYATAYYALIACAELEKGKTVFIHSGASAIGQASIAVALSLNCDIFTLTKNKEETALLKTIYPQLKDRNICNSEELSFEKYILTETKGKGVDVVLNTLRGKGLQASRRLVAKQGLFMDIAFSADGKTQLSFYTREQRDYRFQLDALSEAHGPEWRRLYGLVQTGIQSGVVKPLRRSVYGMNKIVEAFKNVEAEKETGKVLIKIRDEERKKVCPVPATSFSGIHRTCFDQSKSYVMIGGMGGMGMECAHWMVLRGARKLLLTSRVGIATGYQARKIKFLESLGAQVDVVVTSVTTREKADSLIERAKKMGPVGGLFNLATVLHDDNFLDQNPEGYVIPLEAKITTTTLLDQVSREKPVRDTLDHFVMFSSLVVSHGHMGQSNYAWGNSVLERICDKRNRDGLPAVAAQWASIADVGIVALKGNTTIITRKFPQRFHNVLKIYDFMMSQDAVVITSFVLAEKSLVYTGGEESMADQVAKAVGKILGIKNVSNVDGDKEFIDLGVDSLMSVEIKQSLERDIDLVLSTKDIQLMTFNSLRALVEGR